MGSGSENAGAGRDYAQLFSAMARALENLVASDDDEDALRDSFTLAASGFAARKALLLRVDSVSPLSLRELHSVGLERRQVEACVSGDSAPGVSATLIREAVDTPSALFRADPRYEEEARKTASFAEGQYSAMAAAVRDPYTDRPLAVLYVQTPSFPGAFVETDRIWLDGYARALGLAFGSILLQRRREQQLTALLEGRQPPNAPELIGDDAQTEQLRRDLLRIHIPAADAEHPFPLLVLGEKGTGKELVARFVHGYSKRRHREFVAINCAELTDEMAAARFFGHKKGAFTDAHSDQPGLFRSADGGVLFLDEIAHLSVRAQATLLGVLENHLVQPVGGTRHHSVDVMLILATNRDIDDPAVRESFMLEDFYDRISVRTVHLAPLRTRPWDVPILADHFRLRHEARMRRKTLGFSPDALRLLSQYEWPGNVRELSRVCDLLVSVTQPGERVHAESIRQHYRKIGEISRSEPVEAPTTLSQGELREATREFQRQMILSRIERFDGNLGRARRSLGLPWTTMKRYLTNLGIDAPGRGELEGGEESA